MALEAGGPVTAGRQTPSPPRVISPNGMTLNLSSNNPFRNRLSGTASSPRSADATQQNFPFPTMVNRSNNPFLDPSEPAKSSAVVDVNEADQVDDVFKDLSMLDKPNLNGAIPPRPGPPGALGPSSTQQRPLVGDERSQRPPRGPMRDPNSPQKKPEHRRRASESSMMEHERRDRRDRDRSDRPPRTESEERRRRERRKQREERHKQEQERIKNGGKPRKPQKNLDLIDKLDVTGVYGQGLFHHDGPFDACRPSRNAGRDRRAPLQAFPEGSMNMAIGGAGPNNSRLDLDKFHGRTEEGFTDYSRTRKADTAQAQPPPQYGDTMRFEDPTAKTEMIHGEETYGLGTSTFLEGAPASRSALQRRISEDQANGAQDGSFGGGLTRKKSLAQRFRGMSGSRPRGAGMEIRSPDARYNAVSELSAESYTGQHTKALSAGGRARATNYNNENEINPYDEAFERKGTQIRIAEQERPNVGRARAPSSPKANGLTRSVTAEASIASPSEEKPLGGGFLNRMKSLKGRPKRPERKESSAAA